MLSKPDGCKGCPLYANGQGFVPDTLVDGAEVLVVGSHPDRADEMQGRAFVGAVGRELEKNYLPKAGLSRANVSFAHVLRCRFVGDRQHSDNMPTGKVLSAAVAQCRQYDVIPPSVRLIVALGENVWRKYDGPGKINEWRGFLSPKSVGVCLGDVLGFGRLDSGRIAVIGGCDATSRQGEECDYNDGHFRLGRAAGVGAVRVLGMVDPLDLVQMPRMVVPAKLDWIKVARFLAGDWPAVMPLIEPASGAWFDGAKTAPFVVIDTETTADNERRLLLVGMWAPGHFVSQFDYEREPEPSRRQFGEWLRELVCTVPIVFQNALFDVPVLERHFGISYGDYREVHDTLLMHNVLWSEWPHDLEFLASVYGSHEKMKHLAAQDPYLYNAGDVVDTGSAYLGMDDEFTADPQSRRIYMTYARPLIPVILETQKRGIRVHAAAVQEARVLYEAKVAEANAIAQGYCGYPVNLASPKQLLDWLVGVEGMKLKSTTKDAIADARSEFLLVDPDEPVTIETTHRRISEGGHPLLEARVLGGAASKALSAYIRPLFGEDGCCVERVFPAYKPWAQANARWSITDPPLMQLPHDLDRLYGPDEGWPWFGWDYDQIELRVFAYLAGDEPLLETFDKGWDAHTIHCCQAFGWDLPPLLTKEAINHSEECRAWREQHNWEGSEDVRRVFAKRFVFRLLYGGNPRFASGVPGARTLGLDGARLVEAAHRWLAAHPAVERFWRKLLAESLPSGTVRTFHGRRRRLFSRDLAAMKREIYDYPMQGAVSDISNGAIRDIWAALKGDVYYVYGVHDSQWWAVREEAWDRATTRIKQIALQAWHIGETAVSFPAAFKERRGE